MKQKISQQDKLRELLDTAYSLSSQSKFAESEKIVENILANCSEENYTEEFLIARNRRSFLLAIKDQFQEAIIYNEETIRIGKQYTFHNIVAESLRLQGLYHAQIAHFPQAIYYCLEALQFEKYTSAENARTFKGVRHVLSGCYAYIGLFDEAVTIVNESIALCKKFNIPLEECYSDLGMIYGIKKDFANSHYWYSQIFQYDSRESTIRISAQCHAAVALLATESNNEEATRILEEVYYQCITNNYTYLLENCQKELARAYSKIGEYEKAKILFEEIFSEKKCAIRNILSTLSAFYVYCLNTKQYELALQKFQEFDSVELKDSIENQIDFFKIKAELYGLVGDFEKAFHEQKRALQLQEKYNQNNLSIRAEVLHIQFKVHETEREQKVTAKRADELERLLFTHSLQMSQTNTFIRNQVAALEEIIRSNTLTVYSIRSIIHNIKSFFANENSWEAFEYQFTRIHPTFNDQIAQKFPTLTVMERRICALTKLNLSTKEIASMLCISPHTVDLHRSSIRKKIQLPRETKLSNYFANML